MLSPFFLCTRHCSAILFVIHPQKVKHTMKHEDLNFFEQAVAEIGRLRRGTVDRNGDFPRESACSSRGKRKHVGRIIVTQKLAVQAPEFAVIGNQTFKTSAAGHGGKQAFGKGAQLRSRQTGTGAAKRDYRRVGGHEGLDHRRFHRAAFGRILNRFVRRIVP